MIFFKILYFSFVGVQARKDSLTSEKIDTKQNVGKKLNKSRHMENNGDGKHKIKLRTPN